MTATSGIEKPLTVFLVAGRLPKALTVSKAEPIIQTPGVGSVMIFRQEPGYPIRGAEYLTLPAVIGRLGAPGLRPLLVPLRTAAEFAQLLYRSWKNRPALIHAVGLIPSGWLALTAGWLSGRRSVISIIGGTVEVTTYRRFPQLWERLNLWVLRHSAGVTTTGSRVTGYLRRAGITGEKIFELGGSVDVDRFSPSGEERDIDILFAGTFRRLKGPDRVLSVVENIAAEFPCVRSCFLGSGYLFGDIRRLVVERGLERNVIMTGHVDDPVPYFRRAKLLLMPSRSEGLSIAMLEAMACGCVPVVSDVGNTTDAAIDGVTAMVVPDYTDVPAFTRHARELLMNGTRRERMARNGRALVVERYSVQAQAVTYDGMIAALLDHRTGREAAP